VFCNAQVLTKLAPGAMTVLSGIVTSLTYAAPLHEATTIVVGADVAVPGVVVSGGVKINSGKIVVVGPAGVSVGSDGVNVEADCSAASVLAASVEYTESICVAEGGLLFVRLAA
jgi:acetylglutamate kinase